MATPICALAAATLPLGRGDVGPALQQGRGQARRHHRHGGGKASAGAMVKSAGGLPISTAMACSNWARCTSTSIAWACVVCRAGSRPGRRRSRAATPAAYWFCGDLQRLLIGRRPRRRAAASARRRRAARNSRWPASPAPTAAPRRVGGAGLGGGDVAFDGAADLAPEIELPAGRRRRGCSCCDARRARRMPLELVRRRRRRWRARSPAVGDGREQAGARLRRDQRRRLAVGGLGLPSGSGSRCRPGAPAGRAPDRRRSTTRRRGRHRRLGLGRLPARRSLLEGRRRPARRALVIGPDRRRPTTSSRRHGRRRLSRCRPAGRPFAACGHSRRGSRRAAPRRAPAHRRKRSR